MRWLGLLAATATTVAAAVPSCDEPGPGWCVARRVAGTTPGGELGFRFGEPRDLDGDGRVELAAGARFVPGPGTTAQNGLVLLWSTGSSAWRQWPGSFPDGLFGHGVLPLGDLDSDHTPDVVIAAPTARVEGSARGVIVARSPRNDRELWQRTGMRDENFGWDMALAGDQDGDGREDIFVGSPSHAAGRTYLVSGATGAIVRTYTAPSDVPTFGWYVAALDDLDGDRLRDVAIGAPTATSAAGDVVGAAFVVSSANGRVLHHWHGSSALGGFGEIVAWIADNDGDGHGDIAVAAPRTSDQTRALPGDVAIHGSRDGRLLQRWTGRQPGELYGRMVVGVGDLDGDGLDDIAISAPWWARGAEARVGRIEFRSTRAGTVLADIEGPIRDGWFGWHVRRAVDPDGLGRPALLVSALRESDGSREAVGALYVLVWRGAPATQGTTTRDARRSDIK